MSENYSSNISTNTSTRAISPPVSQVNTTAVIVNNPKSVWAPIRKPKRNRIDWAMERNRRRNLNDVKEKLIF